MIFVGLDPGTVNFAYSIMRYVQPLRELTVMKCGLLSNPVDKIDKNLNMKLSGFVSEMSSITYEAKHIFVERYVSRGGKVAALEKVNLMLGSMYTMNPKLFSAAVWKNSTNKQMRTFDGSLKLAYPRCAVTPHELDATLIGIYGLQRELNIKILETREDFNRCLRDVEKASSSKKRKTRNQRL